LEKLICHLFLFFSTLTFSQTGFVSGVVTDKEKNPLAGVTVTYDNKGTTTNNKGAYNIAIPADKRTTLKFSSIGYKTISRSFRGYADKTIKFSPKLKILTEKIKEVVINNYQQEQEGILKLDAKKFKKIPGANAGIENLLMTQPGVNSSNELSTQYSVRGGNFDENLVYVNGIEVYRPFLIRSGQQEGLSFLNSDMTENINFTAGGFEAKYGDKLSSALNIHYKKPKTEQTTVNLNLLGASVTYENLLAHKKLSTLIGARYRNNQLLVNSRDTETNFNPVFIDIQSFLSYQPISRTTQFGGLFNPRELLVLYNGNEQDNFETYFGALSYHYKFNRKTKINITASAFNTQEQEYYDIDATYSISEIDPVSGNPLFITGVGGQLDHARNDLDILIQNVKATIEHKNNQHQFEAGIKFQSENIKDRLNEWTFIENNGLALRNLDTEIVNNEPNVTFNAPITPFYSINADNDLNIYRASGYVQWNQKWFIGPHTFWHHVGLRSQFWHLKNNIDGQQSDLKNSFSPRFRLSFKPDWENIDMVFRLAGGFYHQPPSYKELRTPTGEIAYDVNAQESIHYVLSNEFSFNLWNRPFKLTSEAYFKDLNNINAYSLDNVRIRYDANNNTNAYAAGLDFRLSGEFVPGKESWMSLGFLKTEENTNNRGYIARPTDQRFKFAMLFQDYVPSNPNFKVFLNLVINSNLPGGSPINASAEEGAAVDRYNFQNRTRPYRRADLGAAYIIVDKNKQYTKGFLKHFKELDLGIELFNMFDINNTTTNTWIYDVDTETYNGIPNTLTGRILNFKLGMQF